MYKSVCFHWPGRWVFPNEVFFASAARGLGICCNGSVKYGEKGKGKNLIKWIVMWKKGRRQIHFSISPSAVKARCAQGFYFRVGGMRERGNRCEFDLVAKDFWEGAKTPCQWWQLNDGTSSSEFPSFRLRSNEIIICSEGEFGNINSRRPFIVQRPTLKQQLFCEPTKYNFSGKRKQQIPFRST